MTRVLLGRFDRSNTGVHWEWREVIVRRLDPSKNSPPALSSHEKPQLRCDQVKDDSTQDTDHFRTHSSSWRSSSCQHRRRSRHQKRFKSYTFVQSPCVGHHQKYESDVAVALSTDSYLHLIY